MRSNIYLFILLFINLSLNAQEGYKIDITLTPIKNQPVYLGHHYGKKSVIIDSVLLNEKSEGSFTGLKKLNDGIYFISYPQQKNLLSFVIDKNQKFGIIADTSQISLPQFTSSPENTYYTAYQNFVRKQNQRLSNLSLEYMNNKKDSARLIKEYQATEDSIIHFRKKTIKEYPDSYLAALLKAMLDPEVPQNDPNAKTDSLYAFKYIKAHFWDGMKFYEDRMLRTPFFEPKLDRYFSQLVPPIADSVNKEIDWMVGYASINVEMQKFLLLYFINRYLNTTRPFEEAVFIKLYEKYFTGKTYPWLTAPMQKTITAKAHALMASNKGQPATDIELTDADGMKKNLLQIHAPYTLLLFWDVTCGHCRQVLPRLDSIYQTKWKSSGVQLFAVAKESDGTKTDWKKFIDAQKINQWIHVYNSKADEKLRNDAGLESYLRLYDVTSFPTIYMLDKEKRIVARKINYTEIDALLDQIQKTSSSK